ncbi:MAG: hypothetical protein ABI318_20200 [Chthoniobacteraceae bacterium]
MNHKPRTRREFLGQVGQGTLLATLGCGIAKELGLTPALAEPPPEALTFGPLEPLVQLMQDTPAKNLLPLLTEKLRGGTDLKTLVTAGAYANARTFGGQDYDGYHTVMAMGPAFHMSREMPAGQEALPIFKVLYRNTACIQGHGGRKSEVMHAVKPAAMPADGNRAEALQAIVRTNDMNGAEQAFAALAATSPEEAFNDLLYAVQDHTDVHRVVLPYRSWDLLGMIGMEQAHTMLRQSLRFCVGSGTSETSTLLPKLLEEHKLMGRQPGDRKAEDAWVDKFSMTIFNGTPKEAATAVAAALAEGISPADIGEAVALAANQLILRDTGRTAEMETNNKPLGSVHGASIGVHACDSANAWRNMARVSNTRNNYACLILGAYQVAQDRVQRGGDFLHWSPLPVHRQVTEIHATDPDSLLRQAEGCIRNNQQAHACAAIARYGELNHDPRGAFNLLLKYAVSEDGSLHAEKFYRTCSEEFAGARSAFRWRYLIALARVTASEFGRPAAGVAEARQLLKV